MAYNPQIVNNSSQVKPPAQQTVQIPKSICALLNEDALKKDQEDVTAEDVNAKFSGIGSETTENTTVTMSCHCELTLALRAFESECTSTPIKIGVSNRICWLCEQYLDFLSPSQNVRILISEYQGIIHTGWRIPERTPVDVKTKMHILVDEEVTEIRESIMNQSEEIGLIPTGNRDLVRELLRQPDVNCLK